MHVKRFLLAATIMIAAALALAMILTMAVAASFGAGVARADDASPAFELTLHADRTGLYLARWTPGDSLTITIDDPATSASPDFAATATVPPPEGGSQGFGQELPFATKPGDVCVVTDGKVTRSLTVAAITIDSVDLGADTVTGTASPGSSVRVEVGDAFVRVTADPSGGWTADFAGSADLSADTHIGAMSNNGEDLLTVVNWPKETTTSTSEATGGESTGGESTGGSSAAPSFELWLRPSEVGFYFFRWTTRKTLTITIDDPSTAATPDFQSSLVVYEPKDGTQGFGQPFDYVAKPGDTVVVTDGSITKTAIIPAFGVDRVDVSTDTVSGTALPASSVRVEVGDSYKLVTADATGAWSADFSGLVDIDGGTPVDAMQHDAESDSFGVAWTSPSFELALRTDHIAVFFARWRVGKTLTLTVDDPATPTAPDFQSTVTYHEGADLAGFGQDFPYVAKAGDIAVVTDGSTAKTLTIASLAISSVDAANDVVQGTAAPGAQVRVEAGGVEGIDLHREVVSDPSGKWTADFSGLIDITPGVLVQAMTPDGDQDLSVFTWRWPEVQPAPTPAPTPTPASTPKNDLASSIPLPSDVAFTARNVGGNVVLAVVFAALFGLTSTLFNFTLKNNSAQIVEVLGPIRERASFVGRIPTRRLLESMRRHVGGRWLEHVLIVLLAGLIYSFLDPDFGRNWEGLVTFIALTLAVAVVTYTFEGLQALASTRRYRIAARLKLFPLAIAIAVACVLVSRATGFRPGYVYGVVALLAFLGIPEPDERKRGRLVFIASVSLLGVGLVAWGLTQPLRSGLDADASALKVVALLCKYTFLTGLEGVLFALIPLRFMPGWELQRWNKWVWGGLFTLSAFLFWFILINRGTERELYGKSFLGDVNVRVVIGLLVFWTLVTLAVYLFFSIRRRRLRVRQADAFVAQAIAVSAGQEPAADRPQSDPPAPTVSGAD